MDKIMFQKFSRVTRQNCNNYQSKKYEKAAIKIQSGWGKFLDKKIMKCYSQFPIDAYYINLDKSVERKKHIESLDFVLPLKRFSACLNKKNGAIGCGESHITVLNKIYQLKCSADYTIILEDDFTILNNIKFKRFLIRLFDILQGNTPDVVVMSGTRKIINKDISYNYFFKLFKCNTTSGYIIKKSYIPKLIESFEASVGILTVASKFKNTYRNLFFHRFCPIDQLWTYLQKNDEWYIYYDSTFMMQKDGYSFIGKCETSQKLKNLHLITYSLNKQFLNNYDDMKWSKIETLFDTIYWDESCFDYIFSKDKKGEMEKSIINKTGIIKI